MQKLSIAHVSICFIIMYFLFWFLAFSYLFYIIFAWHSRKKRKYSSWWRQENIILEMNSSSERRFVFCVLTMGMSISLSVHTIKRAIFYMIRRICASYHIFQIDFSLDLFRISGIFSVIYQLSTVLIYLLLEAEGLSLTTNLEFLLASSSGNGSFVLRLPVYQEHSFSSGELVSRLPKFRINLHWNHFLWMETLSLSVIHEARGFSRLSRYLVLWWTILHSSMRKRTLWRLPESRNV